MYFRRQGSIIRAPLAQPPFCGKCGEKFGGRYSRINHEKTCPGSSPFLRSAQNKRDPLAANAPKSVTRRSRATDGETPVGEETAAVENNGHHDDGTPSLEDVVFKDEVFPIDRISDDDAGGNAIGIVGGLE